MIIRSMTALRLTGNYGAMVSFYRDDLGLRIKDSWDRPDGRGTVFVAAGSEDAMVEVLQLGGEAGPDVAPVNLELVLRVEDARVAHDHLRASGTTISRGLEDTSWGHRSFGVDDPDGLRIWLVEVLPVTEQHA